MNGMNIRRAAAALCLAAAGTAMAGVGTASADPGPNGEAYWEAWLEAEGYTGVDCTKTDREGPFTVPSGDWVILVLKAGSGDDANEVIWNPVPGTVYEQTQGKDISHAIACIGLKPTTSTTTTPPTSTTSTTTSTTPPTTTTSTGDTPAPPPPGAGPSTPGVVQTDGGPLGSPFGLLALVGLAGAGLAAEITRRKLAYARQH